MRTRTILVCGALLLTVACAASGDSTGEGSGERGADMNMQEAAGRADAILDSTFAGIRPAVEWTHGESTQGSCDVSRRRAVLTVISEERRGSFLGVVERVWKAAGYHRIGVTANADSPATYFETPDRFRVRLLIGGSGQAFFEVATPCVEESPVAPPPPGGVDRPAGPIPRPQVRSSFWSVGAP
ncbi:hypothetical protein OG909_17405 [Streptomyces sp. NBC_01754]|uniref:hypothetical protein n=1 Tax=Streptomyces sp. NBC_01754 TaxID=2975930 RepID=UPI002DDC7085|nr:hypothetical protein [Streptomyces sp. NBC_01754]WSC93901.1 hypothetical protein OG909_17405 [Streptomyces sp. NBC_01754]